MQSEDDGSPAAAIAIPIELSRLAAIPIRTKRSFQLDPVLHELIRIYNAKYQDCQYCQNARQAVAVQHGPDSARFIRAAVRPRHVVALQRERSARSVLRAQPARLLPDGTTVGADLILFSPSYFSPTCTFPTS